MENLNIWHGLLITIVFITLWKFARYWFGGKRNKKFDPAFWLANNWGDYPIHIAITWAFFYFEKDLLGLINPLILKTGMTWQIPSPDNKGFIFILIPLVTSFVFYPLLRRFFSKPIHKAAYPGLFSVGGEDPIKDDEEGGTN